MNGIPIQYLNGTDAAEQAYNEQLATADKTRRRKFQKWQLETPDSIRRRQATVQYYTRGLDNKTVRNIGYISKGLDFVGYQGDGSIDDSEMVYNHLLRTKQVVDSAPQAVAVYQNPQQLSEMLGYVLSNWDSANREQAIENMAREESRLIDEGKINVGDDSDAHFLDAGENYDPDTQHVLMNGAVETDKNKRGLFNRLKKTMAYVNVAQKDADVAADSTLTRKLKATIRQNVAANRQHTDKNIQETRIKNGHVRTKTIKVPVYTAQSTTLQGLCGVDDDLQELLHGVDFAYNADEGLTVAENIDNHRRYFARLSAAIATQPLAFFDSEAEAAAVRRMLAQLIPAIGNDAAMDALCARYENGINGVDGLGDLGKLFKKIKNAVKKTANAVASSKVVKSAANVAKSAAKATASVAKSAAKVTTTAAKTVAKTAATAAKGAVNVSTAAVKSAVNATKATANVVKAGAQAATGNKDKAKETLKKAGEQAKSAVTQPAKAVIKTTVSTVKTGVDNVKDVAKTTAAVTKDVVKNVVVEPTKTVVKETIVKPTVAAAKVTAKVTKATWKLTKKIAKGTIKLVKKAVKIIWLYNPITLLIKGGLLVAFKLNMFRMASRSYLGSLPQEEAIKQYGITPEEWEAQKKSYDFIYKMFCKIFGGKESKLLAALKKGASKKWKGTDNPTSEAEIKAASATVEADETIAAELEADMTEDKKELEAQGIQASDKASAEAGKQGFEVQEDNRRTTKENTAMYEQSGEDSAKVTDLPKGTAIYISTEKEDTDGTWIAANTTDGKFGGYVKIAALAEMYEPEGQAVIAVSGLCDNGYGQVGGLGEPVTVAASTAAASGSIITICANISGFFKNVTSVAKDVTEVANTVTAVKEALSPAEQEAVEASMTPAQQAEYAAMTPEQQTAYTQQIYAQQRVAQQSAQPQGQTASGGINKKVLIGVGVGLAGLGLIAALASRSSN